MKQPFREWILLSVLACITSAGAAPVIAPLNNVTIPVGKSLIVPVPAASPNGRPLKFSATSTSGTTVALQTNNPFWKFSVAQVVASNTPGAFSTPFRGGFVTVT